MEAGTTEDEEKIVDALIPEDSRGFLMEYFLNGLFGGEKEKEFTKGLTPQDFDIILSTVDAENSDILHSLNICNTKFDPKTAPSRKVIQFEDLEEVIQPFVDGKPLAENNFKEVTMHIYPKIRRNLRFDITSLTYKIVVDDDKDKGKKVVKDYIMEHKDNNPEKKDILCICTFKLNGKKHKFGKILQLLEQFPQFNDEFFSHHRIAYIIFCVNSEEEILKEYEQFPQEMKMCNEMFINVRLIFYVKPLGEDDKEILNMYAFNDLGDNYYFHMNSDHVIYRADDLLCSGDIIENSIKRKKAEKKRKEMNINKTQQQLTKERNEAFLTFFNFLKNIKDYKYSLYMSFRFDICFRFDEEYNLRISYIDFSHLIAELRTKEYYIIKKCGEILNPDLFELEEIKTRDIDIDFMDNECNRCGKTIPQDEDIYFCYKCNICYCRKCVVANYNSNSGKGKFIDPRHNLLYFKTRDKEQFKNLDIHKLGNDLFAQCNDEGKLVDHEATCNGCKLNFRDSPRYLCLNCRQGKIHPDGFFDYCQNCVDHMMKGDEKGKEIEAIEDRIYCDETRLLYEANETFKHEHNKHVYLMIALQCNTVEEPYYNF